ncbi:hypothetical protein [Pelomonas puraquae]|uniref:hypothetical protein n=1 Tax=Roseateles puraquae TaxID=431059 RepID=UPI0013036FDD
MHQGRFVWLRDVTLEQMPLTQPQLHALVLGLPWQRLEDDGAIRLPSPSCASRRCGPTSSRRACPWNAWATS